MSIAETKIDLFCNGLKVNPNLDFNIAKEIVPGEEYVGHGTKRASLSEGKCMILHDKEDTIANVAVLEQFARKSPYDFKIIYGKGWISKNGHRVINSDPVGTPAWYSDPELLTVFQLHGSNSMATALSNLCIYKDNGQGCKFCALDAGGKYVIKTAEEIKIALQRIEGEKEQRMYHKINGKKDHVDLKDININSGTLPNSKGIELHREIIKAMKEVSGTPIALQICPLEKAELEDLHSDGVDTISFNMEVFNEEKRNEILPGKAKNFPIEKYLETIRNAVKIFGDNQVSSWLIAGLETPESTIKGCRAISEAGAIPHVVVHRPLIGTQLAEKLPPPKDDVIKIYQNLRTIIKDHGIDPLKHKAGCIRCGGCSATIEAVKYGV